MPDRNITSSPVRNATSSPVRNATSSSPGWGIGYREARAAGFTEYQLRRGEIRHPHHGVYATAGAPADVWGRCREAAAILGDGRWFSHLTAARLWGMPLPFEAGASEALHVMSFPGSEAIRRPGMIGWVTDDVAVRCRSHLELPLVAPADVWCQLAIPGATAMHASRVAGRPHLTFDALVAVGDYLLTGPYRDGEKRQPLCSEDDLDAAIRRRTRKRGVQLMREVRAVIRPRAQSPRETQLRLLLVAQGLPEPEVQVAVVTADGIRHSDLGYPDRGVLLEYQGDHHRTDRAQWMEDLRRRALFEDAGYRVIEVTALDLAHPAALVARIRSALR